MHGILNERLKSEHDTYERHWILILIKYDM